MPAAMIWGAGGGIGRALLKHLIEQDWTVWAMARLAAYAAAKAGLEAFVDTLRKEEQGWSVTLVRPQAVNTPFWHQVPFKLPPRSLQPNTVVQAILDAYHTGQKGNLDL